MWDAVGRMEWMSGVTQSDTEQPLMGLPERHKEPITGIWNKSSPEELLM